MSDKNNKRKNIYPDWVEKYRTKGHTIRKVRNGYGLYSCTSVYVKGSYPKSVQTYLGMITEKDGFIPKQTFPEKPLYLEYGLSHFIWINFKRTLQRSFSNPLEELLVLGIIMFMFGDVSPCFIRSTFIAYGRTEELAERAGQVHHNRIKSISNKIDKLLRQKIPDDSERDVLVRLLMLAVIEPSSPSRTPSIPEELRSIIERNGLKYE